MARLLNGINHAEPRARTDFAKPFIHFQQFLRRRGIVVVVSDFYEEPERVVKTVEPLRFQGNELILFHILDPDEIKPALGEPVVLVDMETNDSMEVSPEYARSEYRHKMSSHIDELRVKAEQSGVDYFLLPTDKPLDTALREYLSIRQGRM